MRNGKKIGKYTLGRMCVKVYDGSSVLILKGAAGDIPDSNFPGTTHTHTSHHTFLKKQPYII